MPSVLFRLGDHVIRRHFNDLATCRGYRLRFGQSYKQFPVNHLWIGQDATWPLFGLEVAMWCICAAARLRLQTVLPVIYSSAISRATGKWANRSAAAMTIGPGWLEAATTSPVKMFRQRALGSASGRCSTVSCHTSRPQGR